MLSRLLMSIVVFTSLVVPLATVRAGESIAVGNIRLETAWARASIGTSRPAAAYLTIVNVGIRSDRLVRVETPVADKAEVHKTIMTNGIMTMRPAGIIEIPAGGRVRFAPGGLHIMLMGLRAPLKKGGTLPLTLTFERNGRGTITAHIAGPGARKPPQ